MSTQGIAEPAVLDLSAEPSGGKQRSWQYPALVVAVVVTLLGGVLALVMSREGEPTPTEALAEVREFVKDARTATFVATSESTSAPKSGDVGHSSTSRSRATGQVQLPDRAHVVSDDGDYASEIIVVGNEHFMREADNVAALAGERWERWTFGEDDKADGGPSAYLGGPGGLAVGTAAEFLSAFGPGASMDLDELFEKLKDPERLDDRRIRATAKLADLVPEEVKREIEELRAKIEAEAKEHGEDPESDDEGFEAALPSLDGTLTATIEYGDDGRLDVLTFDFEQDMGDDRSIDREEIRFADWGKPFTIEPPAGDQVDRTPHIDEDLLAQAQSRFTVYAPSAPPAGWELQSLTVEEHDDEIETCESVDLGYTPADVDPRDYDGEDEEPPALALSSMASSCEWLADSLPDMEDARRVRIGPWTGRLIEITSEDFISPLLDGLTVVITIGGTTVMASSNLPEAQFLAVLRTLAPIDLAKQPVAQL